MFKFGEKVNRWVEELVKLLPKNSKVLDLGCGMGASSMFLSEKGFEVTCIDKDKENIEHIKKNYPEINAINRDILDFDFPEKEYDLVLAVNLLHFFNFEDVKLLIDKIIKSLKNNGLIYLQVFSKNNPYKEFPHLFDKKELEEFFAKNKILELEEFSKKESHPPRGEHEHRIIRALVRKKY